jgi:CBS domain-containing protein
MPMAQTIRDVMTPDPVCLDSRTPIVEAARAMRDRGIGDVIVMEGERLAGIVTDRDIAIRAVAEGRDTQTTTLGDVASRDVATVAPDTTIDDAVMQLRGRAVRRLPVVEGDRPVGIVAIGDLAVEQDPGSALADISSKPANT